MGKASTTIIALTMLFGTYAIVWSTPGLLPLYFQIISTVTIITGIIAMYVVERKEKKGG